MAQMWGMSLQIIGRRGAVRIAGIAFILLLPMTGGLAQSARTLEAFRREAHLGTVEDALVGIAVTNQAEDGSMQTRHGNGLMLRCDGFILAPAELFNTRNVVGEAPTLPKQKITITLHPGTAQEQSITGRRPNWYGFIDQGRLRYRLGYAVLKIDDVHAPAARVLLPEALTPGKAIQVAWSAWNEAANRFEPMQTRQARIGTLEIKTGKDAPPLLFQQQVTPLSPPPDAVPPGALVVGPDDLVVGMQPGSRPGGMAQFANFSLLHLATNCVTALPSPDAAFLRRASLEPLQSARMEDSGNSGDSPVGKTANNPLKKNKIPASAPGMVYVPGGPVLLPKALLDLQLDLEKSVTACVAPFLIDQYEVTNEQYWAFWQSLPEQTRRDTNLRAELYPYGWAAEDAPFPAEVAQTPVLGVRLPGARAYAKWAGKRLPTPYEWCLAAFGPTGGNEMPAWAHRYLKQRQEAWQKIVTAHLEYARSNPDVLPQFNIAMNYVAIGPRDYLLRPQTGLHNGMPVKLLEPDETHPGVAEFARLPWFFRKAEFLEAASWSKQAVETLTEPLFTEWNDPMYVLPVGSRPYDVSPYGAYDMVMNAEELVVPGPFYPWNRPPNPNWPSREIDRYMHIDFGNGRNAGLYGVHPKLVNDLIPSGVPLDFPADKLHELPTILQLLGSRQFVENDMLLWNAMTRIRPKEPVMPLMTATTVRVDNGLSQPNYTDRMLSRRIHTAAENARPGTNDFVAADLGAYTLARAGVLEFSEMLRPAEEMKVSLQPGPTHDMAYANAEGTLAQKWMFDLRLAGGQSAYARYTPYPGAPGWAEAEQYVDGTMIRDIAAKTLWSDLPRHFHREMGRTPGKDHDRPYNVQPRAPSSLVTPDTFLVPGGFRCVR